MSKWAQAGEGCGGSAHAPPGKGRRRKSAPTPVRPGATFPGAWVAHMGKCPCCRGCRLHRLDPRDSSPAGWAGRSRGSTHPCPPSPPAPRGRRSASQAERSGLGRGSSGGSPGPRACRGAWPASSCEGGTCSWGSPACAAGAAAPPRPRRASSGTASAPSTTFLLTQVREGPFQHLRGLERQVHLCQTLLPPCVHTALASQPPSPSHPSPPHKGLKGHCTPRIPLPSQILALWGQKISSACSPQNH